jgi:hypothetical protein
VVEDREGPDSNKVETNFPMIFKIRGVGGESLKPVQDSGEENKHDWKCLPDPQGGKMKVIYVEWPWRLDYNSEEIIFYCEWYDFPPKLKFGYLSDPKEGE